MLNTLFSVLMNATMGATSHEKLANLKFENATITNFKLVPEGPPPQLDNFGGGSPPQLDIIGGAPPPQLASLEFPPRIEKVPSFYRVQLDLTPTSDSLIKMEIWLPTENWNGKFMGSGNGLFGGSIQGIMMDMPEALLLGYATAGTDTGHQEEGGQWAIGHPDKMIDFAYRSTHEMTLKSKEIIKAYYGREARYSYFKGCSTGGRQALMEAQRFPDDYDGIIAGSNANRHIHIWVSAIARSVYLYHHPEAGLTEKKAALVNKFIMDSCDTLKEGYLNNPHQHKVDFSKLLSTDGSDNDHSLTEAQLKTVETFYNGVWNSKGELIFSGQALGNPIPPLRANDQGPGMVFDIVKIAFNNPNLDWKDFDLDRDMPLIDEALSYVDAVDPDLNKFKSNGGKLLLTHGWSDFSITPETTIWYYERVLKKMGENQGDWLRLFMVPGMGHCFGGPGVKTFDSISALENWVENGIAPDRLVGTGANDMTRPLFPYPKFAAYKGAGELKDAENWVAEDALVNL